MEKVYSFVFIVHEVKITARDGKKKKIKYIFIPCVIEFQHSLQGVVVVITFRAGCKIC